MDRLHMYIDSLQSVEKSIRYYLVERQLKYVASLFQKLH